MAITAVASGGTAAHSTSSSTWTPALASNLAANDWLVVFFVTDNLGTTDGNNNEHLGITGEGLTWTKLGEYTNGNGAAAAGVTISAWLVRNTSGATIGTVDPSLTLSGAVVDKCCLAHKFAAGPDLALVASTLTPNATDASANYGSVTISGLSSAERLYFRALGKEANAIAELTPTSTFTALGTVRSRNNVDAVLARGEFKIATSTGETSNPTQSTVGDTVGLFFALSEGAGVGPGVAVETDQGLALTALHRAPPGLSLEADAALAPAAAVAAPPGIAVSVEYALALVGFLRASPALAVEADAALAAAGSIRGAAGIAVESSAALAPAASLRAPAGLALEIDTALALAPAAGDKAAIEIDTALAPVAQLRAGAGLAVEADSAIAPVAAVAASPGIAVSAEFALALQAYLRGPAGMAEEADTAFALAGGGGATVFTVTGTTRIGPTPLHDRAERVGPPRLHDTAERIGPTPLRGSAARIGPRAARGRF